MKYKLGEIFDLQMGKTPDRHSVEFWNEGTEPWIAIADLSKCNKYIENTAEKITVAAVEKSGIKLIPKNTVIMSFKLSIGKVAITSTEMYSNEAIMAFIDNGTVQIEPTYLYYLLMQKDWDAGINKAVMGKTLNKATLSQMSIDIHKVSEQKEIIKILDTVSSLIKMRKQQLAKLDELVKSRFVEMFDGYDYPICRLGDVCTKITDGTHKTPNYLESGVTFISAKNIVNGGIDFTDVKHISDDEYAEIQKRCQTEVGDILLSKSGSLGAPAIVKTTERIGLFESLAVLKYDRSRLLPEFLCEQLKSDSVQRQFRVGTKGVAIKHLHLGVIADTNIIVPPIEAQTVFAAFVEQTDKSKLEIQTALTKLETLKKALMQQYFG